MKNLRFFLSENFHFLAVKFSVYLNRPVFVVYVCKHLTTLYTYMLSQVHIEALNDSQFIGMCLYNVVVLSAVGLTLNLILDDQPALLYGITSGVLIIGTTATQLVVFVPKVSASYFRCLDHRYNSHTTRCLRTQGKRLLLHCLSYS